MKLKGAAVATAAALVWTAVLAHPAFDRLEGMSLDALNWLRAAIFPVEGNTDPSPTVVVAIDEETYRTPPFKDVPKVMWTGRIARVLSAVLDGGAATVGFDVVFPTSVDPYLSGFDREMLLVLRKGAREGRVVLGAMQHSEKPIAPYAGYRVAVGRGKNIRALNVVTARDGVARRVPLFFQKPRAAGAMPKVGDLVPSMSLEMARRKLGKPPRIEETGSVVLGDYRIPARRDEEMIVALDAGPVALRNDMVVDFGDGPAAIPTFSLVDLYRCAEAGRTEFFRKHFAGRVVMLGTVLDVEDRVLTAIRYVPRRIGEGASVRCMAPAKQRTEPGFHRDTIPGIYLQAAAVNNMVRGNAMRELDPMPYAALTGALVLAMALVTISVEAVASSIAFAVGVLVWALVASGFFRAGWVVPLFDPMAASALTLTTLLGYRFAVADRAGRHIRKAFTHYLAPAVVDRLVERNQMPEQGGELRDMTVWISDLEKYSTISENLPPRELVKFLNQIYSVMTDTIEEHGGFVSQFAGDAVVAGFGAPLDDPDHADKGVRAALACDERVRALGKTLHLPKGLGLRNRIGISSGELLVGNIGSKRRLNYAIVGDDINLASRLEGTNKIYGSTIIANETTVRQCGPELRFREIDMVRVVGRDTPVRIFEPLGLEVAPARERDLEAFAEALAAYRAHDFGEAAAMFGDLAERDPVARAFVERSWTLLAEAPPDDWDGVFTFDKK